MSAGLLLTDYAADIGRRVRRHGVAGLGDFLTGRVVEQLAEAPLSVALVRGSSSSHAAAGEREGEEKDAMPTFPESAEFRSNIGLLRAVRVALEHTTMSAQYDSTAEFTALSKNASSLFMEQNQEGDGEDETMVQVERTIVIKDDQLLKSATDPIEGFQFSKESAILSVKKGSMDAAEIPIPAMATSFEMNGSGSEEGSVGSEFDDEGIFVNDLSMTTIETDEADYVEKNAVFVSDTVFYMDTSFGIRLWSLPGSDILSGESEFVAGMEAFLIVTDSQKPHVDDMKIAKALQKQKNVIFVCFGLTADENIASQCRTMKSQYRKMMFEHALWGMPLFIVCPNDMGQFGMDDLCKALTKWERKRLRARKSVIATSVYKAMEKKGGRYVLRLKALIPLLCGASVAGSSRWPFVSFIGDIMMLSARNHLYKTHYGIHTSDMTALEELSVQEEEDESNMSHSKPMPRTLSTLAHTIQLIPQTIPCTLLGGVCWSSGYLLAQAFPIDHSTLRTLATVSVSALAGALALAITHRAVKNFSEQAVQDADAVARHAVEVTVPAYIRQRGWDAGTTRLSTRAPSPPGGRLLGRYGIGGSRPGMLGALSRDNIHLQLPTQE